MNNSDINKESLEYLKKLPLKELRKRQDITSYQIKFAYENKKLEALERLQLIQDQLIQAVMWVAFKK